jgi:hypothetical protein
MQRLPCGDSPLAMTHKSLTCKGQSSSIMREIDGVNGAMGVDEQPGWAMRNLRSNIFHLIKR